MRFLPPTSEASETVRFRSATFEASSEQLVVEPTPTEKLSETL